MIVDERFALGHAASFGLCSEHLFQGTTKSGATVRKVSAMHLEDHIALRHWCRANYRHPISGDIRAWPVEQNNASIVDHQFRCSGTVLFDLNKLAIEYVGRS